MYENMTLLSRGGSVRPVFLSACVSVSHPDDGQGCVPKLLLSDLSAAKQPTSLCPPPPPCFYLSFFR